MKKVVAAGIGLLLVSNGYNSVAQTEVSPVFDAAAFTESLPDNIEDLGEQIQAKVQQFQNATETERLGLAAITNRTLRIESSAGNATAQILAGAAALSASNNDFFGQILYSYAFPIPISNFGDGVYVTVSQMSGDMSLTLFGMDRDSNGDLFYSTAGLSISGPGTYSADFGSFTDLDSGHPVNFAALDGLGVVFENSSSGPSSVTLTSFGLTFTPVPEPSSAGLLGLALLFGLAVQSRSRETA